MYYLYVLYNPDSNSKQFYIGVTQNIQKRIKQHKEHKSLWTSKFGDWKFVYCEIYLTFEDAQNREMKLKNHGKGFSELKKRIKTSLEKVEGQKGAGLTVPCE